jgi:hypothetical protein
MSQRLNRELISEINHMEEKKGEDLKGNPEFLDWVRKFRKKYLVDGFLMPFYARNADFSIAKERVSQNGDYILPLKKKGQLVRKTANERIHNENSWFWSYLRESQDAISCQSFRYGSQSILLALTVYIFWKWRTTTKYYILGLLGVKQLLLLSVWRPWRDSNPRPAA